MNDITTRFKMNNIDLSIRIAIIKTTLSAEFELLHW